MAYFTKIKQERSLQNHSCKWCRAPGTEYFPVLHLVCQNNMASAPKKERFSFLSRDSLDPPILARNLPFSANIFRVPFSLNILPVFETLPSQRKHPMLSLAFRFSVLKMSFKLSINEAQSLTKLLSIFIFMLHFPCNYSLKWRLLLSAAR